MSEEFDLEELDELSLSEGTLAELERQLEEEENLKNEEVEGEDSFLDEENENEGTLEESEVIEDGNSSLDTSPNSGESQLDQQIEAELDDMADGISEVQLAVKLRLRLKDELLERFQLQHTLKYIGEKYQKMKEAKDGDASASQAEIDELNERISELKEILDDEKAENDKMYAAILKLRAAKESLDVEQRVANQEYIAAAKRRQESARNYSVQIQQQTMEFVDCKRDQNKTIKELEASLKKSSEENERWKAYNAEIQKQIDDLESNISSHLKKKESYLKEKEEASEDHSLAVQKLKQKITRQQRQFELTNSEAERKQSDIDEINEKLEKIKAEDIKMTEEMEEWTKTAKKKERANTRQKEQIKILESDKEDARRKLREAERKLRMKRY